MNTIVGSNKKNRESGKSYKVQSGRKDIDSATGPGRGSGARRAGSANWHSADLHSYLGAASPPRRVDGVYRRAECGIKKFGYASRDSPLGARAIGGTHGA